MEAREEGGEEDKEREKEWEGRMEERTQEGGERWDGGQEEPERKEGPRAQTSTSLQASPMTAYCRRFRTKPSTSFRTRTGDCPIFLIKA